MQDWRGCDGVADRGIDLVGDMEDVVREKRPVGAVLFVAVLRASKVVERIQAVDRRIDCRRSQAENCRPSSKAAR